MYTHQMAPSVAPLLFLLSRGSHVQPTDTSSSPEDVNSHPHRTIHAILHHLPPLRLLPLLHSHRGRVLARVRARLGSSASFFMGLRTSGDAGEGKESFEFSLLGPGFRVDCRNHTRNHHHHQPKTDLWTHIFFFFFFFFLNPCLFVR